MKKSFEAFLLAGIIGISGCQSLVHIDRVEIGTPGLEVLDSNGSLIYSEANFSHPANVIECEELETRGIDSLAERTDANNFGAALALGGKKVRLNTPYSSEQLYGVLVFCKAYDWSSMGSPAYGAALQSYRIVFPHSEFKYVAQGGIASIFETYKIKTRAGRDDWVHPTWILWVSTNPLW